MGEKSPDLEGQEAMAGVVQLDNGSLERRSDVGVFRGLGQSVFFRTDDGASARLPGRRRGTGDGRFAATDSGLARGFGASSEKMLLQLIIPTNSLMTSERRVTSRMIFANYGHGQVYNFFSRSLLTILTGYTYFVPVGRGGHRRRTCVRSTLNVKA